VVSHPWLKASAVGLVIGCYDGFFGPGTGTFLAIAFYMMLRLDLVTASGNARLANRAQNTGALVFFRGSGKGMFPLAFFTAAAGMLGNSLGSNLAVKGGERVIRPLMVVMLIVLLAEVVHQQW